jgi:hypothetical protein
MFLKKKMLLILQKEITNQFRNRGGKAMLYVERNGEGTIIAMHSSPQPNASEEKSVVDEELLDFLNKTVSADSRKLLLSLSDMGIIRLLEDLIDLLIHKNVIFYTELPEQAQEKIRERKRLRETITPQTLTVDDIL